MAEEQDKKRLEELRDRLYSRTNVPKKPERFELKDNPKTVRTNWQAPVVPAEVTDTRADTDAVPFTQAELADEGESVAPPPHTKASVPDVRPVPTHSQTTTPIGTFTASTAQDPMPRKTNRRTAFRIKLLLAGIFFFVVAVGLSSLFILFGSNAISGENIAVNVNGPFTIGGGEILRMQIGVSNQNAVPIESATLIIEYPPGTQSATEEEDRELFTERLPLDVIDSGQTVNIPVQAKIFGEENSELTVRASVEYRVRGSNATFFKEAQPLDVKISSSPVVLTIDSVNNIAAGQDTEVNVIVKSNAPNVISDVLVQAEYPVNFDFTNATPRPASGQNIWLIEALEPGEERTITLRGSLVGAESDTNTVHFSVGVPNERDRYTLASVFSTASAEFELEEPFLDVQIEVADVANDIAVVPFAESTDVVLIITNTLENTIYDAVVDLVLTGNAISDTQVLVGDGFYDSNTRKIRWDVSGAPELEQIVPGGEVQFTFSINPNPAVLRTPQINLDAVVTASRLAEVAAQEEVVGTVQSIVKVSTGIELVNRTRYGTAFSDSGPIPPVVGETTTYSIEWGFENGSNDISGTTMTAVLPTYVDWLDNTSGDGSFSFNPTSRVVTWQLPQVPARTFVLGAFQVAIRPSASQIGQSVVLAGEQRFRTDDDFTGTVVRDVNIPLITVLPENDGYTEESGLILPR